MGAAEYLPSVLFLYLDQTENGYSVLTRWVGNTRSWQVSPQVYGALHAMKEPSVTAEARGLSVMTVRSGMLFEER
jgi:hypothetical protein